MVAPIQFDAGPLDSALEITSEFGGAASPLRWNGCCAGRTGFDVPDTLGYGAQLQPG